ncbi:protein TIC isoform X1 [Tripterygium wilfordii]|uniref:Protein TIC isoform X1 n=1 Tax=Tripterygium wilfordii TaxID=458696 RepID=A0A7J7BXT7_TRIWF|nr:protein TIC isoform X1 [Tripterygium wilfordii]
MVLFVFFSNSDSDYASYSEYDYTTEAQQQEQQEADPLLSNIRQGRPPGEWDPVWADEEDWEVVNEEIREGRDSPIAPFYIPYRKPYPVIPDNHYDISNPKAFIEELDRIEEFFKWVSYIFPDGSSYVPFSCY